MEEDKFLRWKISTYTAYNTLKTHTKYAHSVRGRLTLKDVERFRNGSVSDPYERSLYERTFMNEPFIEKMLCQLRYLVVFPTYVTVCEVQYDGVRQFNQSEAQ